MKTKLKQTNGITLIALIITIIILLILAMVTIRILMNQGIIKHAQNATEAYSAAQNNELEYLTYTEGEMDKYAGGSDSGSSDTYTPPAEDLDALKRYFMGTKEDGSINEEGQSLMNVLDMEKTQATGAYVFNDDEATIGSRSNVYMFMSPYVTFKDGREYEYYYIKYKDKDAYRLVIDSSANVKDVAFVYHPQGVEGEKREYNNKRTGETEQWTVLYDKGATLELVSPSIISIYTYSLGVHDPNATGGTDIEKAIDSYNNAVNRLNSYCKTTLSDNTARCVGSNSDNPDSDNPGMYTSEDLASWHDGVYNGVGKKSDDNAEQDFVRMVYHGVNVAVGNTYWLASRLVHGGDFFVKSVGDDGRCKGAQLWGVQPEDAIGTTKKHVIRACVTVAK